MTTNWITKSLRSNLRKNQIGMWHYNSYFWMLWKHLTSHPFSFYSDLVDFFGYPPCLSSCVIKNFCDFGLKNLIDWVLEAFLKSFYFIFKPPSENKWFYFSSGFHTYILWLNLPKLLSKLEEPIKFCKADFLEWGFVASVWNLRGYF